MGAASRIGVPIKGGDALRTLGKIPSIALDKTGTLTHNKPAVIDVAATCSVTRGRVLSLVAGLKDRLGGSLVRLGRPGWISSGSLSGEVERMQRDGAIAVPIEEGGHAIGAIAVRDELRLEAREVIARLTASGYTTAMLTGDKTITAAALGKAAGITEIHADLGPEDKVEIIRSL